MDTSWRRCEDVWFDEGTIILEAEGVVFRPFRGLLMKQCAVLNDILSIPSTACNEKENTEMYDGCPLVHMHDSSRDLESFLRALHDPGFYDHASSAPFTVVSGILRLSAKYDVPILRRRCIAHLARSCPDTLEKYMLSDTESPNTVVDINYVALVSLLREVDALSLLPAALYHLCITESSSALYDGVSGPDGARLQLSEMDKRACVIAYPEFVKTVRARLYEAVGSGPCSSSSCYNARLTSRGYTGIVARWPDNLFKQLEGDSALCARCKPVWASTSTTVQNSLWDELPGVFGLPSW